MSLASQDFILPSAALDEHFGRPRKGNFPCVETATTCGGTTNPFGRIWKFDSCEHDARLKVSEVIYSCGTRLQGRHLRNVLQNLVELGNRRVIFDFGVVTFCSSSSAVELIGWLLVCYGFMDCLQRVVMVSTQGI